MRQTFVIILLFFMGLTSACEKSSAQLCGGDEPEKTLPWLRNEIERLSTSEFCYSFSRSTYKNQTVFILATCDPNVDSIPFLYDCDGTKLNLTVEDYQNLNFTGDIELIWKNR